MSNPIVLTLPLCSMKNVFEDKYPKEKERELIQEALNGSKEALEGLINLHYNYIYNIALRFVLNPEDAEDLTQEVWIKTITKLPQFNKKSEFRTWLYRIVFNHFLNTKRRKLEYKIVSFDYYGQGLENNHLEELTDQEYIDYNEKIEDYKISCMTGMLLCLNREQRLVFILGEIFEVESNTASQLLEVSAANFRQILARARRDLYNFMNNKCGLLKAENPCRCSKKTKELIQAGKVDPENIVFNKGFIDRIRDKAIEKIDKSEHLIEDKYAHLFKEHPFYDKKKSQDVLQVLLNDKNITAMFNL